MVCYGSLDDAADAVGMQSLAAYGTTARERAQNRLTFRNPRQVDPTADSLHGVLAVLSGNHDAFDRLARTFAATQADLHDVIVYSKPSAPVADPHPVQCDHLGCSQREHEEQGQQRGASLFGGSCAAAVENVIEQLLLQGLGLSLRPHMLAANAIEDQAQQRILAP